MDMSGVTLTPDMKTNLALGHNGRDEVVPNWDLPTLAGAGALRSNAEDMLAFLDANVGAPVGSLEEAMRVSHEPRAPAGEGAMIGLNWITRTGGERSIVWHNGGTGGYRTFIGFDPEREVGVVVLTNSSEGSDDIGFHLLDPSVPLIDPPPPPEERTEIEVRSEILQDYVGVYELAPGVQVIVSLGQGGLEVRLTGQPSAPIYPETESDFFYKVVDAQITFVRDGEGRVSGTGPPPEWARSGGQEGRVALSPFLPGAAVPRVRRPFASRARRPCRARGACGGRPPGRCGYRWTTWLPGRRRLPGADADACPP